MPLASIKNFTSMRGKPAGMGGMPLRSKRASERQSFASSRSPCTTWMATLVWPSTPVEKDGHVGLAFYSGGELFGRRGRNGAVALDNLGHYAAQSFDAQRERSHIEQQHVFGGC